MALPNIFQWETVQHIISRIDQLNPESKPKWGTMDVAQMLAHCNVTYEMIFTEKHKKPNFIMKWVLKKFVKEKVVNETPYIHNSPTGPQFLIKSNKNFNQEKQRLIDHLKKTHELGGNFFNLLASHSFGPLTTEEWNNMLYKHLDHHLNQFGV